MLGRIEPAAWTVNKTEAIEPASDFWWIDDDPTDHDLDWLRVHQREDRLMLVSADRNPNARAVARSMLV